MKSPDIYRQLGYTCGSHAYVSSYPHDICTRHVFLKSQRSCAAGESIRRWRVPKNRRNGTFLKEKLGGSERTARVLGRYLTTPKIQFFLNNHGASTFDHLENDNIAMGIHPLNNMCFRVLSHVRQNFPWQVVNKAWFRNIHTRRYQRPSSLLWWRRSDCW